MKAGVGQLIALSTALVAHTLSVAAYLSAGPLDAAWSWLALGLPLTTPIVAVLSPRWSAAVAGIVLPIAVLCGWGGLVAGLVVALAALVFLLAVLANLADLCRQARWSLPRVLGIAVALTLGLTWWLTPEWILPLAVLAVLANLASTSGARPMALTSALGGVWLDVIGLTSKHPTRAFFVGLLSFTTLAALVLAAVPVEHLGFVAGGAIVGSLLVAWQRNPWRVPGLVPYVGLLLAIGLAFGVTSLVGVGLGGIGVILVSAYVWPLPSLGRVTGLFLLAGLAVPLAIYAFIPVGWVLPLVLVLVGSVLAAWWWLPQFFEQTLEIFGAPLARVWLIGPGAEGVPFEGPLVLVANHTAFLDPFWVCKRIPRKATAMMTSVFYDLPGIRWLMRYATQAIRVPVATARREAPELAEAIEVLRAGGCLLVFPEARLRKTEEKLLFPFGQGLWHILRAVPEARVMTLWVDGPWGSWTSLAGGKPPTVGKPIDFLRRIQIGISEADAVSQELLEDREAFRQWLMEQVLGCRAHLGLPVPTVAQAIGRAEEEPHQNDSKAEEKS